MKYPAVRAMPVLLLLASLFTFTAPTALRASLIFDMPEPHR
jgi:hypothetical protein